MNKRKLKQLKKMALDKFKKARMFAAVGGKCEYCGVPMILSFDQYCNEPHSATFDHLYNKDHEERKEVLNGERRIFIVCKSCNQEKSKTEPNKQEANGVDKTVRKLVPKVKWTDEMFMDRITRVVS